MKNQTDLKNLLNKIDHCGYPAYKELKGSYQFDQYMLCVDHVQGDPFASPSKISIHIRGGEAAFPTRLYDRKVKRIALQDHLLRLFFAQIELFSFKAKGSGKSGLLSVSRCGQEILERSGCALDEKNGDLVLRMEVGFPANGRKINARELQKIFFEYLPICVKKTCFYQSLDPDMLDDTAKLAEDQQYIRDQLPKLGLVAFVACGSILPRASGISQKPMKHAVEFQSPKSMEVTLQLPNHGTIKGMGLKKGINLIVGGGYHGKSTLLKALELGVYNHIAGDKREYVITDQTAMKIRSEDGRSVKNVDISMFINDLPNKKDTTSFYTEDASGSTSQAANVIESMEAGAGLLLMDEDTSATNFMIRDELMKKVVHRESEPITPLIDRIRSLYEKHGISSIIVAGSSGSYFQAADCIIQMDHYVPREITEFAKSEADKFYAVHDAAPKYQYPVFERKVKEDRSFKNNNRIKIKTMGRDLVSINHDTVDLRSVEQLIDGEQLLTLGYMIQFANIHLFDGKKSMREVVEILDDSIDQRGFAAICEGHNIPSDLARPRKQEIFACLNRYRSLNM